MLLRFPILLVAGALAFLPASGAMAQDDQTLTPKQQDAVRKLVHDYILENPGIVAEAIDALREKEELAAENAGRKALVERHDDLVNDPNSPALGNPKGDVTIVEFFDYRCPYCKAMADTVSETVEADKKVRLVMKEWPILGPESIVAAKAALAVRKLRPAAYWDYHLALMHQKGALTEATILKIAADFKVNATELKKAMEDPHIDEIIKKNLQLARAIDLTGTPGFVIGDQLITSTMSADALKKLIDLARKPNG